MQIQVKLRLNNVVKTNKETNKHSRHDIFAVLYQLFACCNAWKRTKIAKVVQPGNVLERVLCLPDLGLETIVPNTGC